MAGPRQTLVTFVRPNPYSYCTLLRLLLQYRIVVYSTTSSSSVCNGSSKLFHPFIIHPYLHHDLVSPVDSDLKALLSLDKNPVDTEMVCEESY
jgi:hypothetical protein